MGGEAGSTARQPAFWHQERSSPAPIISPPIKNKDKSVRTVYGYENAGALGQIHAGVGHVST